MRTDREYLDQVEKIARDYVDGKTDAIKAMNDIVSIFKVLWD